MASRRSNNNTTRTSSPDSSENTGLGPIYTIPVLPDGLDVDLLTIDQLRVLPRPPGHVKSCRPVMPCRPCRDFGIGPRKPQPGDRHRHTVVTPLTELERSVMERLRLSEDGFRKATSEWLLGTDQKWSTY